MVVAAAKLTMLQHIVAVVGKTVERIVNSSADTLKNPDGLRLPLCELEPQAGSKQLPLEETACLAIQIPQSLFRLQDWQTLLLDHWQLLQLTQEDHPILTLFHSDDYGH
jgi:hypothetical protein